jgi:hypothetical protein
VRGDGWERRRGIVESGIDESCSESKETEVSSQEGWPRDSKTGEEVRRLVPASVKMGQDAVSSAVGIDSCKNWIDFVEEKG